MDTRQPILPVLAQREQNSVLLMDLVPTDSVGEIRVQAFEFSFKQGEEIRGFSVDGKNPIGAYAGKGAIVIPVSEKPEFLYYAWKPWTQANLINAQGLPASTFKVKVK